MATVVYRKLRPRSYGDGCTLVHQVIYKERLFATADRTGYNKRRNDPGHAYALQIPAGFAINTGIGLMNPFGGQEGYKAVFSDEQDPNKTSQCSS